MTRIFNFRMFSDTAMLLNAAHRHTDIDILEGVDISGNDIMDAEDF